MAEIDLDIRQLIARLRTAHFKVYLLDQGWVQRPSRYADQLYFEGKIPDEDGTYEMYLPATTDVASYRTRLGRALYKLCGIEDRQPVEVARDLIAGESIVECEADNLSAVTRLRVQNSGPNELQVRIDQPDREHRLLPGEAVELSRQAVGGLFVIERSETSLVIRTIGASAKE